MTRVTKEQILSGGKPQPYPVKALDGAEVLIRPLSALEAEEVQAAQVQGVHASMPLTAGSGAGGKVGEREAGRPRPRGAEQNVDLDLAEVVKGSHKAQVLAAHYGLADPAMSVEEAQATRPQTIIEEIGEEVMARSGLGADQAAQIQRFRDLVGGSDDSAAPPVGEPVDGDAG